MTALVGEVHTCLGQAQGLADTRPPPWEVSRLETLQA